MERESQRKDVLNGSQKDEEGEERGEPKRQREKESERVGFRGIGWLMLVRSQSRVLGMKTVGAVCRSQA